MHARYAYTTRFSGAALQRLCSKLQPHTLTCIRVISVARAAKLFLLFWVHS